MFGPNDLSALQGVAIILEGLLVLGISFLVLIILAYIYVDKA